MNQISTDNFTTSYQTERTVTLPMHAVALLEVGKVFACEIDRADKTRTVIKTEPISYMRS